MTELPPFPTGYAAFDGLEAHLQSLRDWTASEATNLGMRILTNEPMFRPIIAALRDPLADHISIKTLRKPVDRSTLELQTARNCDPIHISEMADRAEFERILIAIATSLDSSLTGLRTDHVRTSLGHAETYHVFPPPDQIHVMIGRMLKQLADHRDCPIILRAAFVMLSIVTIHPFSDANGRTSRVIFNLILRRHFKAIPYLPIREITLLSQMDFRIAINRVHFKHDWKPYLKWIEATILACIALQRGNK